MKQNLFFIGLLALMLTAGKGWGQTLLLSDDFDGLTTGNLAGQSSWTKGGSGPDVTVANTTKLTYAGYKGGDNEYVVMPAGSATASRVYKGFTSTTAIGNTFYVSFLLRIASTTNTGDYFITLGDPTTGTTYAPRLFAKTSGAGFVLGASKQANVASATFGSTVLSLNTTYLIVIRYTGVSGSTNDLVYVWVNPSLSSEPSTGSAEVTVPAIDTDPGFSGGNIGNFHWHNRTTNNPTGSFDGVRIAVGSTSAAAWSTLSPLATSFYSKSTGNLNVADNWGHNSNGSGSPAPNFTENNKTYNVRNNATPPIGADWTVSGTNSTVIIGDGTNSASVTANNNISFNSLTINANGSLTIEADKQATISGTLTNNAGAAGLVVASGGSLIHSTAAVPGTVQRSITAADWGVSDDGWHLISSPVAAQNIEGSWTPAGAGNGYDFYAWSEATNTWLNQKIIGNNITAFEVGRGYIAAYEQTSTKAFTGNLNVANQTFTNLSYTPAQGNGWHLLGNPFASAIKWNEGNWALTAVAGTAKIWNESTRSYTDLLANAHIPVNNGFMVQVSSGTNSITIPILAREHNATAFYKSADAFEGIKLVAAPSDLSSAQEVIIRTDGQATNGFDFYTDSRFLPGGAPHFYSVAENEQLSTNSLLNISPEMTINLGFMKKNHEVNTITLVENTLAENLYLTDLKLNFTQKISENPVYSFTSTEGDNPNRFLLHFGAVGVDEAIPATAVSAYVHDNTLYLLNASGKVQVDVLDISGRLVHSQSLQTTGLSSTPLSLPAGVYVVRLNNGQTTNTNKVIIQ